MLCKWALGVKNQGLNQAQMLVYGFESVPSVGTNIH